MINPAALLKAKAEKDKFIKRHPRFVPFLKAARSTVLCEGAVVAITITAPDGKALETNIKISAEDMRAYSDFAAVLSTQSNA